MARILVIDDDELVRFTLQTILEQENHDVTVANDGVEGTALFRAQPFPLVITDLYMPEKEGMETISELILELDKAAEQSSSVHILKLDPSVNIALIQERLSEALGTAGRKPAGQPKSRNGREAPNGIPVGAQPNAGSK